MSRKNELPTDKFDAAKRLLDCNTTQLAKHLGVSRVTLYAWKKGEAAEAAEKALDSLIGRILRQTGFQPDNLR